LYIYRKYSSDSGIVHGRGWDPVVFAVFKTVGCDLSQRQVRLLPLPNLVEHSAAADDFMNYNCGEILK
jgi:hypothetical protein